MKKEKYFDELPKFNKPVFWCCLILIVCVFVVVVRQNGGFSEHYYLRCDAPSGALCDNPLYDSPYCQLNPGETVCLYKNFQGELGQRPSVLYSYFFEVAILITVIGLFVDYFLRRRKK